MLVNIKMFTEFYNWRYGELPRLNMLRPNTRYFTCQVSGTHERVAQYTNIQYSSKYMLTENGCFLPSGYCRDLELDVLDEDGNVFTATHDRDECKFSSSCGWYNPEEHTVYDDRLYDVEDIVSDYQGNNLPIDYSAYCEREDHYVHENDAVECAMIEDGRITTVYTLVRNTWTFNGYRMHDDSDCFDCAHCGDSVPSHERYNDYGSYCSQGCQDNDDERDDLFRYEYHTDVCRKKGYGVVEHKHKQHPIYTGIELECHVSDEGIDGANDFIRACKYAIPTRDGSLSGSYGCEYVFRPESLSAQLKNVADFCKMNGDNLVEDGSGTGCGTYGLHIHVSNHFLSNVDKIKIVTFANKYLTFIEGIGKRRAFHYAKSKQIRKMNRDSVQLEYDRYQLVNTTPSATIEYRFPKSLVNYKHIAINIQLCWAMTMFCTYDLSFTDLTSDKGLDKFKAYVANNANMYPDLFVKLYPSEAAFAKDEKAKRIEAYNQSKLQEAA